MSFILNIDFTVRKVVKLIFTALMVTMTLWVQGQTISGKSSVTASTSTTYSYTDDAIVYTNPNWQVSNGIVMSTSVVGMTYSATVKFYGPAGTQTVTFLDGGSVIATKSVTVSCRSIAAPAATFTHTNNCGNTVVTTSPVGAQWYWQTSSTGTSTSYWAGEAYTVYSAGTYYLRENIDGCWGSATTTTVAINQTPTVAITSSQSICSGQASNLVITNPNGVSGTTFSWTQSASNASGSSNGSGATISQALSNVNGTSNGTVTYTAIATANGCNSSPATGIVTVKPLPQITNTPAQLATDVCTGLALNFTPTSSLGGTTYTWTSTATSGITGNAASGSGAITNTLVNGNSTIGTATYTITPSASGCAGPTKNYVATVVPTPNITVTGSSDLVYGTVTQLSSPAYAAYKWIYNGVDIAGATGQTFVVDKAGSYTLGVKNTTSASSFCLSAIKVVNTALASQAAPVNYVSSTNIMKEGVTASSSLYTLEQKDLAQTVVYLDGVGRTFQMVGVGQSPQQTDVVTPVLYGRYGIADTTFMPYTTADKKGAFKRYAVRSSAYTYAGSEQQQFYQNQALVAHDGEPFARTLYRSSPDARVTEQGAPGSVWQPGSNHTVKNTVVFNNSTTYKVKCWKPDGTTSGNYPDNTVLVNITTDENGNQVRTYTNKLGQVVLKQVQLDETINGQSTQWLETYYLYDVYGRLYFQLPPKAVFELGAGTSAHNGGLAELVYKYLYDSRGRLIEKKVPGAVVQYYVYDNLDRLVLSQDGNLRATNQWYFTKYDNLNRPVYSGLYQNTTQTTRAAVQGLFDPINYATAPRFETEQASTAHGYSNVVFPNSGLTVQVVNYYDHYDFDRNGSADYSYDNAHLAGLPTQANVAPRNLPTGSKKMILGTNDWLVSVAFYDQYDRPIQMLSNNHLNLTMQDKTSVLYKDLAGHIDKTKSTHSGPSVVNVVQRYTYDASWRTLGIYHAINGAAEQQLVAYTYNALGQVIDKKLHNTGGANFMQSVDYRYNIRGWLTSINNAQISNDGGVTNDETSDYFGMELLYNNVDGGLTNTAAFNGNISAIKWKAPGAATGAATDQRSFKYSYDKSDKLKAATFQAHNGTGWTQEVNTLNETMTYDHNGNILTLARNQNLKGLAVVNNLPVVTQTPQTLDNLTYTYKSTNQNQLVKVDDSALSEGFNNGANTTTEYIYNTDGSLTKDDNKGISSITYNTLGKPQQITYTDGRTIAYTYDAEGNKLKMVATDGLTSTTDYVGAFVYTNNALSFFGSPEGRVVKNGSNYEYQYAIADHQGNTRVVFSSATPAPVAPTATFEGDANDQASQYTSVNAAHVVSYIAANHTTGGSKVIRMNQTYKIGPAKSVPVYAGDKIDMEVWEYHEGSGGFGTTSTPAATLINMVAGTFGGVSGGAGESGKIYNGVNSAITNFTPNGSQGDTRPAAYLNYILFDQNYKVLDMGWQLVPATTFTKQKVSFPATINIKEAGYIFVYLSYDNDSNNWVYFDDFKVTHTKSNLIQYNEYYAFGHEAGNSWTRENVTGNNFLANGGTELNAMSNLYDLDFRNFDPILGRMTQVDPMADEYSSITPYNFAFNDPVYWNDPSGADPLFQPTQNEIENNLCFSCGWGSAGQIIDYAGNSSFGGSGIGEVINPGFSDEFWDVWGGKINHVYNNTPEGGIGHIDGNGNTHYFARNHDGSYREVRYGPEGRSGSIVPVIGVKINTAGRTSTAVIRYSVIGFRYVAPIIIDQDEYQDKPRTWYTDKHLDSDLDLIIQHTEEPTKFGYRYKRQAVLLVYDEKGQLKQMIKKTKTIEYIERGTLEQWEKPKVSQSNQLEGLSEEMNFIIRRAWNAHCGDCLPPELVPVGRLNATSSGTSSRKRNSGRSPAPKKVAKPKIKIDIYDR